MRADSAMQCGQPAGNQAHIQLYHIQMAGKNDTRMKTFRNISFVGSLGEHFVLLGRVKVIVLQ